MKPGLRDGYEERVNRASELTRQGLSLSQIADVMGISTRTVERLRRAAGISRTPSDRMSTEALHRAELLLDDGASLLEVARTVGYSVTTINRRFPGRGWTHQQSGGFRAMREALG